MLLNWKRNIFILTSLLLYYFDLLTDLFYYFLLSNSDQDLVFLILLLLQPSFYLLYYYLTLLLPVLCKDSQESRSSCIFSLLFRGPLYVLLSELKMLLSPCYSLVSNEDKHEDRIKKSFISQLIIHSIFESLPMSIYQFVKTTSEKLENPIFWISPCVSIVTFFYCIFLLNLVKQMNSGGLTWIQSPKATLQFYSLQPGPVIENNSLFE